ncbi:hypothetical protein AMTR_s00128p00095630 [Amborella trichopoda]|uniref:Uncharacterized protein n=1 Tax=Amborella trichopoda TaxID=13333 RepID=W1NLU8_AMBTC|nr:hypothetical protein AMTR_s00128p00095630 [Amborella trichopoda]
MDTFVKGTCQIVCSGSLDFINGYWVIPCRGRGGSERGRDELRPQIDMWTNILDYMCQVANDMFNGKPAQEYIECLGTSAMQHNLYFKVTLQGIGT